MTGRHRAVTARRRGGVPAGVLLRQARADAWQLLLCLVVVTLTALLATLTPRFLATTATDEVRAAVTGPGAADAAVTVSVPLTDSREARELDPGTAASVAGVAGRLDEALPRGVRRVLTPPVGALVSAELDAGAEDGVARLVRLAFLVDGTPPLGPEGAVADITSPDAAALSWVAGRRPASGLPVQVALSVEGAAALGVDVGDVLRLKTPDSGTAEVRVSGLYEVREPDSRVWAVAPTAVAPKAVGGSAARLEVTALVSDASVAAARLAVPPGRFARTVTFDVVPDALDGSADLVARQVAGLLAAPTSLGEPGATVSTQLGVLLSDALGRVRAVTAQATLVLSGVIAAALLVLLLATAAVVRRRGPVLAHHREHGATLPAVAASLLAESVGLAVAGGLLGVLGAGLLVPGPVPWAWALPPLALVVVAGPLLGAASAARSTAPPPADRASQAAGRGPRGWAARGTSGARRVVLELALLLLATGAVVALRGRGATASADTLGADLVVVAVPVLVAAVVAVAVQRVLPGVLRGVRRAASGARGPVGILAAARARVGALGVLALVVTTSLVGVALTVESTVRAGQLDGAVESVGGEAVVVARADPGVPASIADLRGTAGVELAAARVVDGVQVIGSGVDDPARLVVVDPEELAAYLTAAGLPGADALRELAAAAPSGAGSGAGAGAGAGSDDEPLPVLAAGLPADATGLSLRWQRTSVPVVPVADAPALPAVPGLEAAEATVVVPRDALEAVLDDTVTDTVAWLAGPGVDAAVDGLVGDDGRVDGAVLTTRAGWLADVRDAPVVAGFRLLLLAAALLLVVVAALAVLLDVTSGATRRAGALAGMRVLGMSRRLGVGVLLGETLAPVLLPAVVGVATGVGLSALVAEPLGLGSLTGQAGAPQLVVPVTVVVPVVVVAVATVVTVAVEAARHQRVRLGQVMRAG